MLGLEFDNGYGKQVHGNVKGVRIIQPSLSWSVLIFNNIQANILVSEQGIAKITDFGNVVLKSHTLEFTMTTGATSFSLCWTVGGPCSYVEGLLIMNKPPEILNGTTDEYGQNADIYALEMVSLAYTHSFRSLT
jgi:serine/threonine protein kinase